MLKIFLRRLCSHKPGWILVLVCGLSVQSNVAQNLPELGDPASVELSPQAERRLGEEVMREIRQDNDYLNDALTQDYLRTLAHTLQEAWRKSDYAHSELPALELFPVKDGTLNAFALPGGFIGVNSGLVLAVQTESELAAVLAHEIGHVAQRHIARMLARQKDDAIVMVASALLAVLAARSSPDAAQAIAASGQALALSAMLSFSRDAEREADRVGLAILQPSGFDVRGMTILFRRLQSENRFNEGKVPAYLRTHPLTSERIADISERIRNTPAMNVENSVDFALLRARLRVLQDGSVEGLRKTQTWLQHQNAEKISSTARTPIAAHHEAGVAYGLALVALQQGDLVRARGFWQSLVSLTSGVLPRHSTQARSKNADQNLRHSVIIDALEIELLMAEKKEAEALVAVQSARHIAPDSSALALLHIHVLQNLKHYAAAIDVAQNQALRAPQEARWLKLEAENHAALGRQARSHISLAQSYQINGAYGAALEQLQLARRAPDATFIDHSIVDAKEREWKQVMLERNKRKLKS